MDYNVFGNDNLIQNDFTGFGKGFYFLLDDMGRIFTVQGVRTYNEKLGAALIGVGSGISSTFEIAVTVGRISAPDMTIGSYPSALMRSVYTE